MTDRTRAAHGPVRQWTTWADGAQFVALQEGPDTEVIDPNDPEHQPDDGGDPDDGGERQPFQVSESEWNKTQAELRRAKKALRALQAAQEDPDDGGEDDPEPQAQPKGKKGSDDRSERRIRRAQQRVEELERKLRDREVRSSVLDALGERGITGKPAKALLRLIDADSITVDGTEVDPESVSDAVEEAMAEYGDLFKPTRRGKEDDVESRRKRRHGGPAATKGDAQGDKPEGYLSPEEFLRTPVDVRHSPDFRKRVEKSRPYWPKRVPARVFAQSGE